jgi:hypothetical protein
MMLQLEKASLLKGWLKILLIGFRLFNDSLSTTQAV